MQLVIIILLLAMLTFSGGNMLLIWKMERVYAEVWGSDVATVAWRRKRWAFVLIATANVLGVGAVIVGSNHWLITLAYFGLMNMALLGFFDSYRILLADLKRLPRK